MRTSENDIKILYIPGNHHFFSSYIKDFQWGMKMEGQDQFGHHGVHDVTTIKPKYLNPGPKPAPTRGPVVSQGKIIDEDEVNNSIKDNLPEWFMPNTLREFNDPLLPPLMPGKLFMINKKLRLLL